MFKRICLSFLILLAFNSTAQATRDYISVKTSSAIANVTGTGNTYIPKFNQAIETHDITYSNLTGYFKVRKSGVYLATWVLKLSNISSLNTGGAGWIHEGGYGGRGYEPFIYNNNPYYQSGASGKITIGGSQIFIVDAGYDPNVWIGLKIGGSSVKNVTLLDNSTFTLKKIA